MTLTILVAAFLAQAQQGQDRDVSPTIRDIIAGYHAWELTCVPSEAGTAPVSCRTEASDQITTVRLNRTAAGLELSLESRRCPDATPAGHAFLAAKLLRAASVRQNGKRLGRVYGALTKLEDQVLKSCGLAFDADGPSAYDLIVLDRFLKQSDRVGEARR